MHLQLQSRNTSFVYILTEKYFFYIKKISYNQKHPTLYNQNIFLEKSVRMKDPKVYPWDRNQ